MTAGIVKGNNLGIFVGDDFIGCTTEANISISREVIEATCKDNDGARQVLGGSLSWTMNASGLFKFDAGYGITDLVDAILADTTLTLKFGLDEEEVGDFYLSGSAKVTNVEAAGSVNDAATWSVTFEGSGLLTKTTIVAP
jgi:predicted secreted protein